MSDKPYWYPTLADSTYCEQLRKDYEGEVDELDDEELLEHFDHASKYVTTWDHTGDAYDDYEPLADAFLKAKDEIERLQATVDKLREKQCGDCPVFAESNRFDDTSARLCKAADTGFREVYRHYSACVLSPLVSTKAAQAAKET